MQRRTKIREFPVLLTGVLLVIVGLLTGCFHSSGSSDRGNDTDDVFPSDAPEDGDMDFPYYDPDDPPEEVPGDPSP